MNDPAERLEVHLLVESPDDTPVDLLHRATGLSRQRIKLAMNQGAVWITRGDSNQRLRRAKRALQEGDEIHLYYDPRVQAEQPPEPALLKDAGGYSVWHKPRGMRSQGSKWGDHCTIMRWAEQHLVPERTSFTVHRLDMAASGLILIAHSKSVAAALAKLFRERRIEKRYLVIVHGDFSRHASPLRIDRTIDDKNACSEASFRQLSADGQRSLVEVRIETGRKHQIRRHLAEVGHPVYGDRLYGSGLEDDCDLQLTACFLAFQCPVNEQPVEYRLPEKWLPALVN